MRHMIYPAPPLPVGPPPPGFEEVWIEPDGEAGRVHAWVREPGPEGSELPAILFLHGNGENLETMRLGGTIERLAALGVPLLVADYPGYGKSTGAPSEHGLVMAMVAAFDELGRRFPGRERVVAGWSLGAAVALQVAARRGEDTGRLILMSPWSRLADVAGRHYPSILVRLLLPERWDSLEAARSFTRPALVIHGGRDGIIPVEQGRQVAELLADGRWVEVEGAGHNDLLAREEVWRELAEFVGGGAILGGPRG